MNRIKNESMKALIEAHTHFKDVQTAIREKEQEQKNLPINTSTKKHPQTQAELNLHGMTQSEARHEAEEFIQQAIKQNLRTIRLIPGKGLHSKDQKSVLPAMIENLLRDLRQKKSILGFEWGKGGGVVLVYLP